MPGSHFSIQAAIDDPGCSEIQLANQTYFELLEIDRSLTLFGPPGGSAAVIGQVTLSGAVTVAVLTDFRIESGCPAGALRITAGTRAIGDGLKVVWDGSLACASNLIFQDGFES